MPQLPFSTALAASGSATPLTGWQYEYLPWRAYVKLLMRATTANVRATVYSGSQTIQEEAIVQGGGTAGVTPSELNTQAVEWIGAPGDRLKINLREVGGAAATVDGVIIAEPV